MSADSFMEVVKDGHVAWAYLNRPEKRNALDNRFWDHCPETFDELDRDPEVRAIILSGRGKCFSAGMDFMSMVEQIPQLMTGASDTATRVEVMELVHRAQAAITAIEACRKPVIAAIHAQCIGGGLDIAAACDVRICSSDAVFSLREVKMAIVADLGSLQRLPHIIGEGWTRQLAFTAEDIPAEAALRIGLVNRVFPDFETMEEAARNMAESMAAMAPLAVQASKEVLNHSRGRTVAEGLTYAGTRSTLMIPSEDLQEAIKAFISREVPEFKGR